MGRFVFVGDTHGRVFHALAAVAECADRHAPIDAAFQVGDFGVVREGPHTGEELLDPTQNELCQLLRLRTSPRPWSGPPLHFIRGNHDDADWLASLVDEGAGAPLDSLNLCRFIACGFTLEFGGACLAFFGGVERTSPAIPRAAGHDPDALARLASLQSGSVDILVTHEPPYGALARDGVRGSRAVADLVEQLQPRLVVSGHLHDPAPVRTIGNTTLVRLGALVRSPATDPTRRVQRGSIAVVDTSDWCVVLIDEPWLTAVDPQRARQELI